MMNEETIEIYLEAVERPIAQDRLIALHQITNSIFPQKNWIIGSMNEDPNDDILALDDKELMEFINEEIEITYDIQEQIFKFILIEEAYGLFDAHTALISLFELIKATAKAITFNPLLEERLIEFFKKIENRWFLINLLFVFFNDKFLVGKSERPFSVIHIFDGDESGKVLGFKVSTDLLKEFLGNRLAGTIITFPPRRIINVVGRRLVDDKFLF